MPSITLTLPTPSLPTVPVTLGGGPGSINAKVELPVTIDGGPNTIKADIGLPVTLAGPGGTAIGATASIGGTSTPITLEAGFRNNTVSFKLFGFIPLLTIRIRP